jgi:hypothetical protein
MLLLALCLVQSSAEVHAGPNLDSSVVSWRDTMYFFGGLYPDGSSSASNDIVTLNLDHSVYTVLDVEGDRPLGRMRHSATMHGADAMFIAGGLHCLGQLHGENIGGGVLQVHIIG